MMIMAFAFLLKLHVAALTFTCLGSSYLDVHRSSYNIHRSRHPVISDRSFCSQLCCKQHQHVVLYKRL
jgi:hypothetical protein